MKPAVHRRMNLDAIPKQLKARCKLFLGIEDSEGPPVQAERGPATSGRCSVSFDTSRDQHNVTAGTSGVLDGPAIVAVNARHCPLYSASSSPSPSDSPAILSRQLSSLVTLRELRRVFVPFVIRYCFTIVRHT
ncbi:hypothetical protein J6590_081560 [Homalodisca vitripennis]|nr:hypothetical protein J6590_081560 [Homalodisca vitripennis]